MIYNPPIKGEDGLYSVKALGDDRRKCLVQLNGVSITEVAGEISFDLETVNDTIESIDANNLEAATENCVSWFGRKVTATVIKGAYTPSMWNNRIRCDRLDTMKVFNAQKESIDQENIQPGKTCDVILEFAGLWFAKKAFGPSWNLVQVKIHDTIHPEDTYPEEYAFVDEDQE
jgi:hypothetical protein